MDGHNDEAQEYKKNKDKENGEAMRDGVLDDGGGNINGFSKLEPSHIPPSSSSSSSDNADVVLAPSVIGSFQGHRCIVIFFLNPMIFSFAFLCIIIFVAYTSISNNRIGILRNNN